MNTNVLTYTYHEDHDIHEFKPHISNRQVITPYIEILDKIVPATIEQEKVCALIIWNLEDAEVFPLKLQQAYFMQLVKKYPKIPPAYILYLTNRVSDDVMIRSHYTSRQDTRNIFRLEQRDAGVQWLLDCREKRSQ